MRPTTPEVDKLFDEGRMIIRGMIRFDFGTGTYGFWDGNYTFPYNGLDYVPGGIISISEIPGAWGMEAQGIDLTLASSPDDGLTPDVLATIENETYHQRPVTLFDAYFHPDTRQLLYVDAQYRGFVDTITHTMGPDAKMTVRCESRALDNSREGYRMCSTADQNLISEGDMIFQYAEVAGRQEVPWGRVKNRS